MCSCRYTESRFHCAALCGQCGGNLRRINATPESAFLNTAILECVDCGREWSLTLSLRQMPMDPGSRADYLRDKRARQKVNA